MTRLGGLALSACALALLLGAAPVAEAEAAFGLQSVQFSSNAAPTPGAPPGAVGPPQLDAGSHPYALGVDFDFNRQEVGGEPQPDGAVKDIEVDLPAGLIGDLTEVPRCAAEDFHSASLFVQGCPSASQVGTMSLDTNLLDVTFPVFNLEPPPGEVANLGVFALLAPIVMEVSIRTGGDYGLRVTMRNLPQGLPLLGGSLSLWGVPADPGHDTLRGTCLGFPGESLGECPSGLAPRPILTLPTACGGVPQVVFRVSSWEQPQIPIAATAVPRDEEGDPLAVHGCEALEFAPELTVSAGATADSPSSFGIELRLPQNENPVGLAEAGMSRAALSLPAGVSVNPAAADGLGSCAPAQFGLHSAAPPACPDPSRIGSVSIDSPLVAGPLIGSVYLATPDANELGSMLAVYLAAERDGALVKLAGRIDADPQTGALSVLIDQLPQLPFSKFAVNFDGGPRAVLALPRRCGIFTATAALTSFSAPAAAPTEAASSFAVDRGCGSGFSPSFSGGATSSLAGRKTALALRVGRADGEESLRQFSITLPSGLLPLLGDVPLCPEPQATAGSCDGASGIGRVAIAAGSGSHPLQLLGDAFLTGPHEGAPFGFSVVVPGAAGPFDLGRIVVRAAVSVDPRSARLTIATDPLPLIRRGIPLRVRRFELSTAARPGFFLAPSGCREQSLSVRVLGADGALSSGSAPFFLAGCRGLRFGPQVAAAAAARVTRARGVGLRIRISNRAGPQSNLEQISIGFPQQLAPRLAAIQAACPRATFAVSPAACSPGSRIGSAVVRTRVFAEALRGAAYLVSRGGEGLPQIVVVLRVGAVTLRLHGDFRLSPSGRATVRFGSMPDAPISNFALRLPSGPDAVLGASFLAGAEGSLCGRGLRLELGLVAHNGAGIRHELPITVKGCR